MTRSIVEFLGVDPEVQLDTNAKFNVSGKLRFPRMYQAIRNSSKLKPFVRGLIPTRQWNWLKNRWDAMVLSKNQPIPQSARNYLRDVYRDDIMELQTLLQRDLSHWLR